MLFPPKPEIVMGHYAAEMACPRCHKSRCTCSPSPSQPLEGWILHGEGAQVISVADYAKKHRPGEPRGMVELALKGRKIYGTPEDATLGRQQYIQQLIDEGENRLAYLRSLLDGTKAKPKKSAR